MLTYNAWILQNQWGIFIECMYVTAAAAMFFFFFSPPNYCRELSLESILMPH